jgi:hypothetical protein
MMLGLLVPDDASFLRLFNLKVFHRKIIDTLPEKRFFLFDLNVLLLSYYLL